MTEHPRLPVHVDVAIVGSGFSGLAMAHRLERAGRRDFAVLERASDVGGTWRDNSYPGCACDVPSLLYSFSWASNPEWSDTFSPQPEIQAYLRRTAREHGLLDRVHLDCEVRDARWSDGDRRWHIETARGTLTARVLVAAAGPLSEPKIPDVPGLETFAGRVFHSANWDHSLDLRGRRVAVVGTGASAVQFVPAIQPVVESLVVLQRTPAWVLPRRSRAFTGAERFLFRHVPGAQRAARAAIYWGREALAIPLLRAGIARRLAFVGRRRLARAVPDPQLRERLTPDFAPGCKRILLSNDWYPALARPNVEVVASGLAEVREHSVVAADGTEREVDTIIFGTGFQVTEMPFAQLVRDGSGRTLAERWSAAGEAHRGTAVAGVPNLFMILGPNTGLGHTSVLVMAEAQAGYILRALEHMDRARLDAMAPSPRAQAEWNRRIQARLRDTVWNAGGCASYYLDRHGRNTTIWPGFTFSFRARMARFDASAYEGWAAAGEPARGRPVTA